VAAIFEQQGLVVVPVSFVNPTHMKLPTLASFWLGDDGPFAFKDWHGDGAAIHT